MGNVGGDHCLACEWVASHLAGWFKLPTFDFALFEVTDLDEIPLFRGGSAQAGPAFITRAESGEPWSGEGAQLNKLINPLDISRLVVFDTWVLTVTATCRVAGAGPITTTSSSAKRPRRVT